MVRPEGESKMSFYDPYTNHQIKALRRDPTGRWSPICSENPSPEWHGYAIGAAVGIVFAVMLWAAI